MSAKELVREIVDIMPKTNAETAWELARLSSDCSLLLTHLVRQNDRKSEHQARRTYRRVAAARPNKDSRKNF